MAEYSAALLKSLEEVEAVRVSYFENPLTGDRVLVRRFPVASDKDQSNGIEFMRKYASRKNYNPAEDTNAETSYVTDPLSDHVEYAGTWRQIKLEKAPVRVGQSGQDLIQTLRIWPAVAFGGRSEASCRFITAVSWYWGLSLSEAQSLLTTAAITASQGITMRADGPRPNGDGTYSVYIYTTQRTKQTVPEYISELTTLATRISEQVIGSTTAVELSIPTTPIQGIIYDKEVSKNEDCTYDERRQYEISTFKIVGPKKTEDSLTDSEETKDYLNSRTLYDIPTGVQGYIYRGRMRMERDGTYSGEHSNLYSKPVTVGPIVTRSSTSEEEKTTDYLNSRNTIVAPAGVQGTVYAAQSRVERDGTYSGDLKNITSKMRLLGPVTTGESEIEGTYEHQYKASRTLYDVPANEQGTVYDGSFSENMDGTYDQSIRKKTSKEVLLEKKPIEDTALAKTQESLYINARTRPEISDQRQGFIYRGRVTHNPDGTYDANLDEVESKPVVIGPVITATRLSFTGREKLYHNARSTQTISRVKGYVYDATLQYQQDGTYDERISEQQAAPVEFGLIIGSSYDETVYLYDKKNVESIPNAVTTGIGYQQKYEGVDKNDYELYDSRLIVRIRSRPLSPNRGDEIRWREKKENTSWVDPISGTGVIINHFEHHHMGWVLGFNNLPAQCRGQYATARSVHINYEGDGIWFYHYVMANITGVPE